MYLYILKTFCFIFVLFLFFFKPAIAGSVINNKSGGPLFLFLVDQSCQPDPNMLKKLSATNPRSYSNSTQTVALRTPQANITPSRG